MPDYLHPGIHIEELSNRMREIEGVPTATAGFVGFAPNGPTDPTTVNSIVEYEAAFGRVSPAQPLSSGVEEFFRNGGTKAVILRAGSGDPTRRRARRSNPLIGTAKAKTGLHALSRVVDPVGLLLVPDAAYLAASEAIEVTNAAAALAEQHGIFHIADVPKDVAGKGPAAAVQWSAGLARSRNLAIYYPWLAVGAGKAKRLRPPSAVAAGIFARMDRTRGVWTAPAGQDATTAGVTGLAVKATSVDAGALQSAGINPIRNIAGAAIVLWGARTFAAEPEWKYISVRRLVLFLENSIEDGLSWAVFEPNTAPLWAQVRLEVSSFLHTAWRAGAFQGTKPDEAYFVRCDGTTMTQSDIDNGRVIAMIGVAPVRPAEFVIIRISLAADAP